MSRQAVFAARLYLRWHRLAGIARLPARTLSAVCEGIALGALSEPALNELVRIDYESANPDENYLSEAYNRSGLFAWEHSAIDAYFGGCRTLIVVAAGAGRETVALANRGYTIAAYECTGALYELGCRLVAPFGERVTYHRTLPGELPRGEAHDGAIIGWAGYTHICGSGRRVAFLRALRTRIRPGGPVLVSGLHITKTGMYHRIVAGVGTLVRRLRRDEPVELGDRLTGWYGQHFTTERFVREIESAGFRVVFEDDRVYLHAVAIA